MSRPIIRVSAALIVDEFGRVLLVRKHGTTMFMQPGGKPEPGESAADALARELHEEVGLRVDPADLHYLGSFEADAANERGHALVAEMFAVRVSAPVIVTAAAEIAELRWFAVDELGGPTIAPLTRDTAPALVRRGA
ncbi:NUDIX hydrolase [Marisediminicola sp. LYQ85]|uniref:NUDIX hydrolase n=1 Tax=Marisediminicola sp. LYQ85 TaxID=3391062 RepID=UPI0039832375